MFARRKNSDGFEWHKYVRTTIKLRREQRKEKVKEAGRAAGEQVGAAGVALLAGSRAAGVAAWQGARAGAGGLWLLLLAAWNIVLVVVLQAADKLGLGLVALAGLAARALRPVGPFLARPPVGSALALFGAVALGAAISRWRTAGFDREAVWTAAAAGVLLLGTLPLMMRLAGASLPKLPTFALNHQILGGSVLAGIAAIGALFLVQRGPALPGLVGLASKLPVIGSEPVQGRALVVGGDRIRIGTTLLRLSGIELPEVGQLCGPAGGRQFRCGGNASMGLSRLIGGAMVTCTRDGSDGSGVTLARCMRGDKEINAEMVRQGIAFAEGGLVMTRYGSEEKEARAAKLGIWAAGDSVRPAEWRSKVWDEAKKRAPEGCPIKGTVAGGQKIYLMPWSAEYERGRITKARGDRWFCSESEAASAGFKAAS